MYVVHAGDSRYYVYRDGELKEFEQAGLEFAYPTQTVHVAMPGRSESDAPRDWPS